MDIVTPATKTATDVDQETELQSEQYYQNLCATTRIETTDGITCRVFSAFYLHPSLVPTNDWRQLESENGTPLMLDVKSYNRICRYLHRGVNWYFDKKGTVLGIYIGSAKE